MAHALPSLARLAYPRRPRDRRANDFIPWESLSREKRAQLWDASIREETWRYVENSDRLKILRASKVIESEPEAFLPRARETEMERYRKWIETTRYENPRFPVKFADESYRLVQVIRLGRDWEVEKSFMFGFFAYARRTLLVRVDPPYKTKMKRDHWSEPEIEYRMYLRNWDRDRTVRVATLYEWARELELSYSATADAADANDDELVALGGGVDPGELERREYKRRDRREERHRRRRIRNMLFSGKAAWRRLRFFWKMRALVIYWASLRHRPDRLDMAAELREAMEGMEGAVGSRFKSN